MQIREIKPEVTLEIRREVMWPSQSIDFVKLPDDAAGKHYGLFLGDKLIAVVSLFITGERAQFRKFATLPAYQSKGYGTALLQHVITEATKAGAQVLWCNARQEKASFYSRFGLAETGQTFTKAGKTYVIMERSLPMSQPKVIVF